MQHEHAILLISNIVNALSVFVLVLVTIWYSRSTAKILEESHKARTAAERQAAAAEESIRSLRFQIEEQSGLARSIVTSAIQSAIRNIAYWQQSDIFDLATMQALPSTIELVPLNATSAVEHARHISVDASAELASAFDSLRHARSDIEIMRNAKALAPYQLQRFGNRVSEFLNAASLNINAAQRLLREAHNLSETT